MIDVCPVYGLDEINKRLMHALETIEHLSASEWAEKYLSLYDPHHQLSGPVDFTRYPFIKEPIEAACNPGIPSVVLCFSAQMLKTTAIQIVAAHGIAKSRMTQVWVMDSESNCQTFSETRWQPFIEQNKLLRDLRVGDADKYKILMQSFSTGHVRFVGSNSLGKLASTPAGKVIMDETENYGRKDAVPRLIERLAGSYSGTALMASTPLYQDGFIWQAFIRRDMRLYFVPCPHCGQMITMEFSGLKWDSSAKGQDGKWDIDRAAKSAYFECPKCAGHIHDEDKPSMCRAGEWRATNPNPSEPGRSYRINRLYSVLPSGSFEAICRAHLQAGKDPAARQNFSNSVLAETYEEPMESADTSDVLLHAHDYPPQGRMPAGVLLLTCGVDVQRGRVNDPEKPPRIEAELVGWGKGEETWGIEHAVFACSAAAGDGVGSITDLGPEGPWARLAEWLMKTRQTEDGRSLIVASTFIDSGYLPQTVYQFCERFRGMRVDACKGKSPGQPGDPLAIVPRHATAKKNPLYLVSRYTGNMYVYAHLRIKEHGPHYMHFPSDTSTGYDHRYFQQLTAERLVKRLKSGRVTEEWVDGGQATEALAMRRYAVAAFFRLNANLNAMALKVEEVKPEAPAQAEATIPAQRPLTIAERRMQAARQASPSNWVQGF